MKNRDWRRAVPWFAADRNDEGIGEGSRGGPRYVKNLTLLVLASLPFLSYPLLPEGEDKTPVRERTVSGEPVPYPTNRFPVVPGPPAVAPPLQEQAPAAPPPPDAAAAPSPVAPAPVPGPQPSPVAAQPAPIPAPPPPAAQPPPAPPPAPQPPPPPPPAPPAECDAIADPSGFDACISR